MNILKILLLLLPFTAMADNFNKWALYPSYYGISQVEPAGKDIFALAGGNLYSYNLSDGSLQTYTRLTGLSNHGAKTMAWVKSLQQLVVAYDNSCIDILSLDGDVITLSDIADKQTTLDKTINLIYVQGHYAYIATGFGILKLNVKECYFAENYNLGRNVTDVVVKDGFIYALTGNGVVKGNPADNLYDPATWVAVSESWSNLKPDNNAQNQYGTLFYDATNKCYWGNNAEGKLTRYEKEGKEYAEKSSGVIPDGPKGNDVWRVYVHDGSVFATAGNFSYGMESAAAMRTGLVNHLDAQGNWTILDRPTSSSVAANYLVANCMAFDPRDKNHYWVGARTGLYEYRAGKCVNTYALANSALSPLYDTSNTESLITSMTYDVAGNLWVLNGWCSNPIVCYDANGQWHNFKHSELSFSNLTSVDLQGAFIARTNGCLWFSNNYWETSRLCRYDIQHDRLTTFSTFRNEDGQNISHKLIFNVTEDINGNVWVASDGGPFYIAAGEVGSDSPTFVQHKVPRNDGTNYADYLLADISIRTIAVDAANRKWMGTAGNGVYLISGDCNTQLAHFTVDNSPLPSNVIFDITVDNATGRVFFATDKGLCSYKADVTEDNGGEMTESSVAVYPNPVTPDYTGMISISGLSERSQLRIMTSSGQLVHKGMCYGGTYEWDGRDLKGQRVASGVYMVGVTDESGEKGVLTKIAIVR